MAFFDQLQFSARTRASGAHRTKKDVGIANTSPVYYFVKVPLVRPSVNVSCIDEENNMEIILFLILALVILLFERWLFEINRKRRRDYYRNVYLKSEAWKRKRYLVLKRDNWRCVYCGARATQVHHKRYAKYNIGKEPIKWLVSICGPCHDSIHQ